MTGGRWNVFRTGDAVEPIWLTAMAVTVALGVLVLTVFPAINHEYGARLSRDAARTPVEIVGDQGATQADPAIGRWSWRTESADGKEISVIFFAPFGEPQVTPPGIKVWPGPNEVYASPGALAQLGAGDVIAENGTLRGTIDAGVLADPKERVLYVGVDAERLATTAGWNEIIGFGIGVDPARGDHGVIGSALYQPARNGAYLLATMFLLGPWIVLLVVVSRLGAERRDRAIALATALGASRGQLRRSLWRASRARLIAGGAAGAAAVIMLSLTRWEVPFTGYVMTPSPSVGQMLALGIAVALVLGVAWMVLWFANRPRMTVFGGTRPLAPPEASRTWPLVVMAIDIALTNWLYQLFQGSDPDIAALVLFAGSLIGILLLAPVTSIIVTGLAGGLLRAGKRRSRPVILVVGRELSTLARPAVRATVFMGVVALVATFASVLATKPSEIVLEASAAQAADGGRAVEMRTEDSAPWLDDFGEQLPPHVQMVGSARSGSIEDVGAAPGLVGTCSAQIALWGSCANGVPTRLGDLTKNIPVPLQVFGFGTESLVTTGAVPPGDVILTSDDNSRLDVEALAQVAGRMTSPVPDFQEPAESWVVGASVAAEHARWISASAAVACLLAVLMGVASIGAEVARIQQRHRVFAIYAGTMRRFIGLGLGLVGLPLFLGATTGALTGMTLSYGAIQSGVGSSSGTPIVLAILLGLCVVCGGLASLLAAFSLSRARMR